MVAAAQEASAVGRRDASAPRGPRRRTPGCALTGRLSALPAHAKARRASPQNTEIAMWENSLAAPMKTKRTASSAQRQAGDGRPRPVRDEQHVEDPQRQVP